MLDTAQIKNLKFMFFVTICWWLFCSVFSRGDIYNLTYSNCSNGTCHVVEKSWFGFGKTQKYVTFSQKDALQLNMRETSGRLPHYVLFLPQDIVLESSDGTSANFVSLPVEFYWKKSAVKFHNQLLTGQDFNFSKLNLNLIYFLNIWISALFLSSLVIIFKI